MLWSLYDVSPLDQASRTTSGPSAQSTARASWPTAIALALREAVGACRQYRHLRSRGMPQDMALRAALGVGHSR